MDNKLNGLAVHHKKTQVYNAQTKEIVEYCSLNKAMEECGLYKYRTKIYKICINQKAPLRIFGDRFILKYLGDPRRFEDAKLNKHDKSKPVLVKNIVTNEIEEYQSLLNSTKDIPINYSTVRTIL